MAIEDRNLEGGEKLVATYKGKAHYCEVITTPDGLRYREVASNKQFTSPSAAGSYVRDGKATNGWAFWSLEGTEKPAAGKTVAGVPGYKKPASITEHREKKAGANACERCGEKRKSAQGMSSHMRAHAREDAKAVPAEASV